MDTIIIISNKSALQPKGRLHTRGFARSSFRSLPNILDCCLLKESGPYLSPSVADHPLRPAKDHRLGNLLSYQLSNPT